MIRRTIISLACALMMTVSKAAAEDPWDTLTFEKLDRVAEAALGNAQDLSLENNRDTAVISRLTARSACASPRR